MYNQHGDHKLSRVVGDSSGNTDDRQAAGGMPDQEGHYPQAQGSAGHAVKDAEHISEEKSDHKDTDSRNHGRFPVRIALKNK